MSGNVDKASAKILVLGDSGVGKSSLIHLICRSTVLSSAQWTIGCSIDVRLYNDHFLEFWDIGGSRTHRLARSFLYQDYHGIILVFDATNKKSRTNLNEWLLEVTQKTHDRDLGDIQVPILTIATKKDLLPYGSILDISDNSPGHENDHSSVVDIDEQLASSIVHRRLNFPLLPTAKSQQRVVLPSQSSSLIRNPVIYVNTQDALSFSPESRNFEKLSDFYKQVIDRRNKRFYNKFAI